jgi:SAM-dependent methyltransferase
VKHTSRYVGIDLSAESIEMARRRFPGAEWLVGDACHLEFPDASFDVVAFSSVLHHIPDFPRALAEAHRVLRPGGKVFAFDPNLLNPFMALLRWPKSPLYSSNGVSPNESPLLPRVLRQGFEQTGLVKLRQRCQSDIPYRAVAPKWANRCLAAFNLVDRCWEHSGLGRWMGTFVITYGEKRT